MKKNTLSNFVFYVIKSLFGVIIPFVSFPLVTRILGAENYGKVAYANSIVNYFIYFASLGISTYAIREGAKYKDDKEKLGKLTKELFIINSISAIIAYIGIISIVQISIFKEYATLIIVHSIIIIVQTIGFEWVFQCKEEYIYISIRHIIMQVIGLVILIVFLKDENDYYIYAIYTVFTTAADLIVNFFFLPKHISFKFKEKLEIKKHIKPVIMMFSISAISTIFQNIDVTMIGLYLDDKNVGIYNSAVRIYNIAATIIASFSTVMFSKSAYLINEEKGKFISTISNFSQYMFIISVPIASGLICCGDLIIEILCGKEYAAGGIILQIYGLNIILGSINRIFGHQILIINKKENIYFIGTLCLCILNTLINTILIPYFGIITCAISSIAGVILCDIIIVYYSRRFVSLKNIFKLLTKPILFVLPFFLVSFIIKMVFHSLFLKLIIIVSICVIIYMIFILIFYKPEIKKLISKSI